MAKNPNWEIKEDEILRKNYGNGEKSYILSLLPNRSWTGIQSRASIFNLRRMNYFSKDEIKFIKKNYLSMRSGKIAQILNRNTKGVENKARELGIMKKFKWTKKDENFLLNNFYYLPLEEISKKIKKSMSSIYHKVQDLNLQRKTERYLMSNDEILEKLISVSKQIGRTPSRGELTKLGLPSEIVFSSRFGSYGKACTLGGLEINTGIVNRKIYISKSGDICLSNAEKKITDFLTDNKISFLKEIPYSEIIKDKGCGKMICDWLFPDGTVVEYFGMSRHKKYAEKIKRKLKLCKKHNIKIIQIFDKDLNDLEEIFKYYI